MILMQEEYFISIALEESFIQVALWNIKETAANIISISKPISYENEETLLTAGDEGLSNCIQNLPENAPEPSKTVFGVPSYWVETGQIERKYLDKIKLLCNKLSLTPTGFVVLPEAIAHFKKNEENTPVSGILIGVYGQSIDISLFRLGNLVGTVNVTRSINIIDDVVEAIARFETKETLPSQFLLYNTHAKDLEEIKQELIKADWNNLDPKIKFLHTPSVEILETDSKMAAVSLAGGAEIANLSKINFIKSSEKKDLKNTETENIKDSTDNIEGLVDPKSLGFSINEDSPVAHSKVNIKLNKFKMPNLKFKFSENIAFIAAISLLVLIVVGFAGFWFLPKADVNIIIAPVKIDEKKQIKFDTNATSVDVSKLIIPAKTVTVSVKSDKTKTTAGTKTIGNPAKGSVTFYNVGGQTTIPAGTTLTASNLQFTLDKDVEVASASGAASASSTKGNITAAAVGADYNLASGSVFSVGNFSSSLVQAKNDSDLGGGSSQEVAAVAKDDISSLTKDLMENLTNTGKDNIKQNLQTGTLLVENKLTIKPSTTSSDHKEGEAASTVKVSLAATVSGLTVSKKDMDTLATELFKNQIKPGFSLKEDQIDFIFDQNDIEFKINLLPSIDTIKTATQIAGKDIKTAKQILSKLSGFQDAEFLIKPNISFLQILPHVAKNISITLMAR